MAGPKPKLSSFAWSIIALAGTVAFAGLAYVGLSWCLLGTAKGQPAMVWMARASSLQKALEILFGGSLATAFGAVTALNRPADAVRKRRSVSTDFKVALGWCMALVAVLVFQGALGGAGDGGQADVVAYVLVGGLTLAAGWLWLRARRRQGWRWPGVTKAHVLFASIFACHAAGLGYVAFLAFRGSPLSLVSPVVVLLVLCGLLYSLRLLTVTQEEFEGQRYRQPPRPAKVTQKQAGLIGAAIIVLSAAGAALVPSSTVLAISSLRAGMEFQDAIKAGDLERVRELLDRYPRAIAVHEKVGTGLLTDAALQRQVKIAQFLLARGADPHTVGLLGHTALHMAAVAGDGDIVELLVDQGVAVNVRDEHGWTPLRMAAESRHMDVVGMLLDAGARHDAHSAVCAGDLGALAAILVEDPAQLDAHDGLGWTPLHLAARQGRPGAAEALLDAGADSEVGDKWGRTAMHAAADRGYRRIVRLLLEAGAFVDARDPETDQTPLHMAARAGYRGIAELLLRHGADVDALDRGGLSPVLYAKLERHDGTVEVLAAYGAKHADAKVIRP